MGFRRVVRDGLARAGWYVRRTRGLPAGIDWMADLRRYVPALDPRVLFDVGANIGQTALWLHQHLPEATIHAFEPVPTTFQALQCATSGASAIHCHGVALGAEQGHASMRALPGDEQNSLVTGIYDEHPDAEDTPIRIETVDRMCSKLGLQGIDILKTDTEGYDVDVMRGAEGQLRQGAISAVVSEATFQSGDRMHTQFANMAAFLDPHGLVCCGVYEPRTLFRRGRYGAYCNALFVHVRLLHEIP